jgi:hypothetical protein
MTQTVSRMYASQDQAARALAALEDYGYSHAHIVSASDGNNSYDGIVDTLVQAYVWKPHAMVYAKGISKGGSLVTVHAPFGAAYAAQVILDEHDPVDSGLPEPKHRSVAWDERTPMSSMLQMPVLAKNRLPMSKIWNVPAVLSKSPTFSGCLGMNTLSQNKAPLSSRLGMSLLSRNLTPLSSRFGMPLLSKTSLKLTPPGAPKRRV